MRFHAQRFPVIAYRKVWIVFSVMQFVSPPICLVFSFSLVSSVLHAFGLPEQDRASQGRGSQGRGKPSPYNTRGARTGMVASQGGGKPGPYHTRIIPGQGQVRPLPYSPHPLPLVMPCRTTPASPARAGASPAPTILALPIASGDAWRREGPGRVW